MPAAWVPAHPPCTWFLHAPMISGCFVPVPGGFFAFFQPTSASVVLGLPWPPWLHAFAWMHISSAILHCTPLSALLQSVVNTCGQHMRKHGSHALFQHACAAALDQRASSRDGAHGATCVAARIRIMRAHAFCARVSVSSGPAEAMQKQAGQRLWRKRQTLKPR